MNPRLQEAYERLEALPEERQEEAAELLLAFLDLEDEEIDLSPEQIAEIEACWADDGPYATHEEVRSLFARLTKKD